MGKELIVKENNNIPDLVEFTDKMRLTPTTKQTYKYAMISFKKYCTKNNLNQDLDSLLQWVYSTSNKSTQATYIAAVKRILGEIFKYDPRLPMLKESLEELRPTKRDQSITESKYLKKSEVDELIKISKPWLSLMIEALFWTGLRVSELLSIKYENCTLLKDKKIYEVRVIGKRRKENTVYITQKLFNKIVKEFNGYVYIFEKNKKPYRREHVSMEIKRAAVKIGRPEISAHNLRHSKAMYLVNDRKLSIDKVQRALNHSSASTTIAFYLHNKPTPEEQGII